MQIEVSEAQANEYNALYKRALGLVRRHVLIDGEPQSGPPGWFARCRLRKGIGLLERALVIAPFKWECRFWIGKSLQRLGEHREAISWFMEAVRQEPENPSIAKEAANEALELGEFELGVGLLRPGTLKRPQDPILHYDLGIHLLLAGKPKEAYESLQRAARLEAHANTSRLMEYVERVMTGQVSCPRSLHELRQGA